ncbi:hypothetical protein JCM39068_28900 [Desulfocastanea catecholica]
MVIVVIREKNVFFPIENRGSTGSQPLVSHHLKELEAEVQALVKIHGPIGDKELADKSGLSLRGATFLMAKLEKSKKSKKTHD